MTTERRASRREAMHGVEHEPALGAAGVSGGHVDPGQLVGDEVALSGAAASRGPSWSDEVARRRAQTTVGGQWRAVALATVVGGPFAVVGAFAVGLTGQGATLAVLLYVVLVGPAIEEVLKASGALWLVERRPWLVPSARVLPALALAAGLVFAALENVIYLTIYIPDPSPEITAFRWVAGPLVHGSASLLAGIGVLRQYQAQQASFEGGTRVAVGEVDAARWPWFLAAWLLHGGWNLTVTVLSLGGWGVPTG